MEEIDLTNSPIKSQESSTSQISNNNNDSISYETNPINQSSSLVSETISQTQQPHQQQSGTSNVNENSIQAITETIHPSDQILQSVFNPPPTTIMTTNQESSMMMMSSQMNPVLPAYQPSIIPQPMIPNYESSIVGNPDSSMMMNQPPQQQQQTNTSFQIPNYGPPLPSSPPIVQPEQQPQYLYSIPQPPSFLGNDKIDNSTVITKEQPNDDEDVSLPDDLVDVYNHLGIVGKILTGGSIFTIRFLQLFRNISETLGDALGITKPKYEQEYLAYQEMKQEEQQRQEEIQKLYATWQPPPTPSSHMNMMPIQAPTNPNFIQPIVTDASTYSFNTQNPNISTSMVNMDCQSPPNP